MVVVNGTPAVIGQPNDGRYAIDVRVFITLVTCTMAFSFMAGIYGVTESYNNGGSYTPSYYESMALSFLFPSLIPAATIVSSTNGVNDVGNVTPDANFNQPNTVRDSYSLNIASEDSKTTAAEHRPSGQHLLVDIKGVDADFLNSEERLSKALVDTVKETGMTLLSYHCHALLPSGVSCVGVLLESHISFHTWPSEGVITLDLFSCGDKPLLPAIATIERLFGIGRKDQIKTKWSHELRGFRQDEEKKSNYLADSSDLSLWVLSPLEVHSKTQVYSGVTKFQRIDIWDLVEVTSTPSYEDVLMHNMTPGDPRLKDLDYVSPDRMLFLDGTIQSIRSTERVYHEAMVHPAMFAHPHPKRVAILGGGEGATLREVLKHKTVESAVMIEIDEELVNVAREHLPDFSDCSDLVGRAANCFDDDLSTIHFEDGRRWFMDRYGANPTIEEAKFDILLVDALDPEDPTDISTGLYSDDSFVSSLVNSLTDDGVLAIQVGTAATIDDPRPDYGIYKNREALFNVLEANPNVQAMFVYEEAQCGFLEPHAFLIVCKTVMCRARWYARSDQVDYEIYDRIARTHSKKRALTFFDGTTQRSYQWPKKGWETVYCRREPTPFECAYRYMDPKAEMHEFSFDSDDDSGSFQVKTVGEDDEKLSMIFATKPIPKGSFIMAEHLASSLMVTSRNLQGLEKNRDIGVGRVAVIEDLLEFFDDYGHVSTAEGSAQHYIEIGGSVLIRRSEDDREVNIQTWIPKHPSGKRPKYSPVYERHRVSFDVFMVASKDIKVGDEVVMNQEMWKASA